MNKSTTKTSSPCERLLNLVNKINQTNPQVTLKDGWISVFDLPAKSSSLEVFPFLRSFHDLVKECRELVEIYGNVNNKHKYLSALNTLSGLPHQIDFRGTFNSVSKNITPIMINDLEYCANELRDYYSENVIPKEQLDALLQEVLNLKKSILELNLNKEIKSHCLKLLQALEEAILDYKIKGIESLVDVMFTQYKRLEEILKVLKPQEQSKFKKLFVQVKNCVTLASNVHSASTLAIAAASQIEKIIS